GQAGRDGTRYACRNNISTDIRTNIGPYCL
ncbi:MAG: hypothetical protein RI920_748, partial [Pseudomonadota bacterium]